MRDTTAPEIQRLLGNRSFLASGPGSDAEIRGAIEISGLFTQDEMARLGLLRNRIMNTEPGWRPSAALREAVRRTLKDPLGNILAQEGVDKCGCGCKYWEHDKCIDCADLWTRQGENA